MAISQSFLKMQVVPGTAWKPQDSNAPVHPLYQKRRGTEAIECHYCPHDTFGHCETFQHFTQYWVLTVSIREGVQYIQFLHFQVPGCTMCNKTLEYLSSKYCRRRFSESEWFTTPLAKLPARLPLSSWYNH